MSAADDFLKEIETIKLNIDAELTRRAWLGSNELRNASQLVLRGARGGRTYRVPGTKAYYQASAPGEPPAVRTGAFRGSWERSSFGGFGSYISRIESSLHVGTKRSYVLGELLEKGTSKMAPRPHHDRILEKAEPKIVQIYEKPYDV
jgi:hypothetical protein